MVDESFLFLNLHPGTSYGILCTWCFVMYLVFCHVLGGFSCNWWFSLYPLSLPPLLGLRLLSKWARGKRPEEAMIPKRYKAFCLKKRGKSKRQLLRIIPMPSHSGVTARQANLELHPPARCRHASFELKVDESRSEGGSCRKPLCRHVTGLSCLS